MNAIDLDTMILQARMEVDKVMQEFMKSWLGKRGRYANMGLSGKTGGSQPPQAVHSAEWGQLVGNSPAEQG
jgi:hypothetical protein